MWDLFKPRQCIMHNYQKLCHNTISLANRMETLTQPLHMVEDPMEKANNQIQFPLMVESPME